MEIKKKITPEYFEKVLSGEKKVELRLADWNINVGDTLVLQEFDPEKKEYTGREIKKKATYIMKTKDTSFFTKEDIDKFGFQIIQLGDLN